MLTHILLRSALIGSVYAASVGIVLAQESAYFGSNSIAQETGTVPNPQTRVSMLCKTSASGPGIALVTLSNLTTSTIP